MANKLVLLCLILTISLAWDPAESSPGRFRRQWIWEDQVASTSRPTPTPTTTTTTASSNGLDIQCQNNCLRSTTTEHNPVCGTDNQTYDNPSKLKCASRCGKDNLTVDYYGPCPK